MPNQEIKYAIHWKSNVNAAAGQGTPILTEKNAQRHIDKINAANKNITYWAVPVVMATGLPSTDRENIV